jgi:hypothetical protein
MRIATILVAGLLLIGMSVCVLGEGTGADAFARDGIGARALGMGGAFVAIADDASAGFWNPAGISYLDGYHLGGMYVLGGKFSEADIKFQDLSFLARPIQTGSLAALGLGATWVNMHIAGIPYTGEDGGGTFSFDYSLFLASGSWRFDLAEEWSASAGVNVKYYRQSALTAVGSGLGFDLAFLCKGAFGDIPVSIGIVSSDTLETTVHWRGTENNEPNYASWITKIGVTALFFDGKLLLAGDVNFSPLAPHSNLFRYSNLDQIHVGVEFSPVSQLAVRGGLIVWRDGTNRLSVGFGIALLGLTIDGAYVKDSSDLGGDTLILSAEFAAFGPPEE